MNPRDEASHQFSKWTKPLRCAALFLAGLILIVGLTGCLRKHPDELREINGF